MVAFGADVLRIENYEVLLRIETDILGSKVQEDLFSVLELLDELKDGFGEFKQLEEGERVADFVNGCIFGHLIKHDKSVVDLSDTDFGLVDASRQVGVDLKLVHFLLVLETMQGALVGDVVDLA